MNKSHGNHKIETSDNKCPWIIKVSGHKKHIINSLKSITTVLRFYNRLGSDFANIVKLGNDPSGDYDRIKNSLFRKKLPNVLKILDLDKFITIC